jgi:hypothetical protein
MTPSTRSSRLAAYARGVPPDRNRVVDLVRVLALSGVVLGHWLKQGWYVDSGGTLHRSGLLGIAAWTHPLTWIFQVIPLFFVVGGYANAVSWRNARSEGHTYGTWLAARTRRLTTPLAPLMMFWVVVAPAAPLLGLDRQWLRIGSLTSLVPIWFLATYLVVVATVPVTMAAWDRWGWLTLVAGVLALPVDALSLRLDSQALGALNLLIVWGTLHQFGYAWRDGTFRANTRAMLMLLIGGLTGTMALVWLGPYGVSMVGVDGYGVNNTNPPRVTLLLLGCALVGLTLLSEPTLDRLAHRPRVWRATVALEARMMTIYLWHLTALVILGAGSLWLDGAGLHDRPNSPDWWAARPLWICLLAATTAAIVVVVGRFEDPPTRRVTDFHSPVLPLVQVGLIVVLLSLLAADGLGASARVPEPWLLVLGTLATLTGLGRLSARVGPRHALDAQGRRTV